MNLEIVAVKLVGTFPCGMKQGTPPVFKAGWSGTIKCQCDGNKPNLNCDGSLSEHLQDQPMLDVMSDLLV